MGVRLYDPNLGRFLEVDPVEGGCSNPYAYVHGDPVNQFDLSGGMQSCANAIDATGYGGAGVARLIPISRPGWYTFNLRLNDWFIASHAGWFSFGYHVSYAVNGHLASDQFAGDPKVRAVTKDIHSNQKVQGRAYSKTGWFDVKTFHIRTNDILYLHIWDYLFSPVTGEIATVSGSLTCKV